LATMNCSWSKAPHEVTLLGDEVHIWIANLDGLIEKVENFQGILSSNEFDRAGRYYFENDRHRYITRRGVLRTILGRYLQIEPRHLNFKYNKYGKPCVDPSLGRVQFNLSHSEGVALYAFTLEQAIGIDMERIQKLEFEKVARLYFSTSEQVSLHSIPPEHRDWAFFACWTRKEAFIKAHGEGLSLPLDSFDVTLSPGQKAQLLATRPDASEAGLWQMYHLEPVSDYLGALVIRQKTELREQKLGCWRFE
jgi:4'-phosphopantetheinyl transferase